MTKEQALAAMGIATYGDAAWFDTDDVVTTAETIADFVEAQGKPSFITDGVYQWEMGKTSLLVVDAGDVRYAIKY
ncbi:hypothetical protein [Hyphomicrobium sp. DY-1]|uniref:hypothetical protein n=1 Tax=Hyphomicrobium sp. DY-1 TaxID=3075650 RepID=UPI0039C028B9